MSSLKIKNAQGEWIHLPTIRGEKGDTGESGVYVGTEAPTDDEVVVWVNPEGEDDTVKDVQMNGTSIVTDGIANLPLAVDRGTMGIVKVNRSLGVTIQLGTLGIAEISSSAVKDGSTPYYAITPRYQHQSTFYGLAKAAGDSTQAQSSNPVGTYTSEAKTAIKTMLGVSDETGSVVIEETGTDLTITAEPNYRYICGELLTLNFTPSSSGICEVIFTSGSTPTVLTLPDTVKMPDWWVDVEANYTYEICITDGVYGAVMSWAT